MNKEIGSLPPCERAEVTLQINVAPGDVPTIFHTVPNQLRAWSSQVGEIIYSVDLRRRPRRHKAAKAWNAKERHLLSFLNEVCQKHPHARIEEVDFQSAAVARLSGQFFASGRAPLYSYAGRPILGYLHGFAAASGRYVLHLDADMLFGGLGQSWVEEAVALLRRRSDVLTCSPLPGPPRSDGRLLQSSLTDEPGLYRFRHVSTRVLLMDMDRFDRVLPLRRARTGDAVLIRSLLGRRWPNLSLEWMMTAAMQRAGMCRLDFLGREPGMWSLHPPYRSPTFYRELPEIVRRIERGEVPVEQRGDYDLNDSMIDWSDGARIGGPDDNYRRRSLCG